MHAGKQRPRVPSDPGASQMCRPCPALPLRHATALPPGAACPLGALGPLGAPGEGPCSPVDALAELLDDSRTRPGRLDGFRPASRPGDNLRGDPHHACPFRQLFLRGTRRHRAGGPPRSCNGALPGAWRGSPARETRMSLSREGPHVQGDAPGPRAMYLEPGSGDSQPRPSRRTGRYGRAYPPTRDLNHIFTTQ